MSDLLSRFRYPLTYLLLFALCVINMASRNGPVDLGVGSRLLLRLTLPLGEMVTLPVRQTREVWRDYLAVLGVREENESLHEEISRLEQENLRYREGISNEYGTNALVGADHAFDAAKYGVLTMPKPDADEPEADWLAELQRRTRAEQAPTRMGTLGLSRWQSSGISPYSRAA